VSATVRASAGPTVSVAQAFLATMSMAAAAIHFAVMGEHFAEYAAFGVFFSVVAWLQASWAVGVIVLPTKRLLFAGLVGNALVVAVWLFSRTTGLPIGPEPGAPEPAAFVDVLSTILEVAIVAGTAVLLLRGRPTPSLRGRAAWLGLVGLIVVLAVLTTWSVAAGASSGGEHGADYGGSGGAAASAGQPGFARVDLGNGGRFVQVLVDASDSIDQVHLTFFDGDGQQLDVDSMAMSGVSPSGEELDVPIALFEPGHYAASLDLESGDWAFRIEGATRDAEDFDVSFTMTIE